MKCCLKIENYCLETLTKHSLNNPKNSYNTTNESKSYTTIKIILVIKQ